MTFRQSNDRNSMGWSLAYALIVAFWGWFCWPMLVGTEVAGFRDSGYLYYPLFQFVDQVWASGKIPLWNPYDGLGRPLLADGSASVFYPGKVVFLLRFLQYDVRYGWFLSLHLLLAAVSTCDVARRWGAFPAGAVVAGLSYAFSGVVLFQVSNAIYLVGAAWLPWGVFSIHQTVVSDDWRWPWLGGIIAAMIWLGGDPQSVYHLGLIGAATVVFAMAKGSGDEIRKAKLGRRLGRRLGRLGLWGGLTIGLAAVQILPTIQWAHNSQRQQHTDPRNLYEAISDQAFHRGDSVHRSGDWRQGLLGTPAPGAHAEQIYQFSQPPWTVVEFALPNVGGRPFPENGRWFSHLPGADRMWTPSLYFGLVGLVFALSRFRLLGDPGVERWLSRIALFFLIASFGWYGPVWLAREMMGWIGSDSGSTPDAARSAWGPYVGGLYWAMVSLLPKYVMFRYPAKLMVLSCLAFSLLAGRGVTNVETARHSIRGFCFAIAGLAVVVAGIGWVFAPRIYGSFVSNVDPLFGPLREGAVEWALIGAAVHAVTLLLLVAAVVGLGFGRSLQPPSRRRYATYGLILICVLDLAVANAGLLALVPSDVFHEPVPPRYRLAKSPHLPGPYLVPPGQGTTRALAFRSAHFAETRSPDRLAQIIRVERAWAIPKWHLTIPAISLESFSSIEPTSTRAESPAGLLQARRATARAFRWGGSISLLTALAAVLSLAWGRFRRR